MHDEGGVLVERVSHMSLSELGDRRPKPRRRLPCVRVHLDGERHEPEPRDDRDLLEVLSRILGTDRLSVVGGWRHDGEPICPEDAGEDLEEVTVVAGLGLVPFTVEVHADAWETTPRLRAAIAELGEGHVGFALDEDTALVVHANELTTVGRGAATRIA